MKPTLLITSTLIAASSCLTASALLAADAARVTGDLTVTGLVFSADPGTVITKPSQMGPWSLITPQGSSTNVFFGNLGGNVGIGTATPTEQLELTGNLKLPTTSAAAGQIRQGSNTLLHTYGTNNFFAGIDAGNLDTTGFHNTAIGEASIGSITTGYSNTATGWLSLAANTSGNRNTANGELALRYNTTGEANTAVGQSTLLNNTIGKFNSATGLNALGDNTTGDYNTAIGFNAGNANTTGSYNTFIGAFSGPGVPTPLTNATAIGYNALVSQSNSLVLGGTGAGAVKVGIGTTTPGATLDALRLIRVLGSTLTADEWPKSGIGLELAHDSGANKGYIVSYNRTSPAWGSLEIQASTVTIGGGSSSGNLTVSGTLNANNIASGTWSGTAISSAKGGTGLDSSAAATGSLLKTTSTGTWGTLSPGSEGQILKMSSGSPVWSGSSADATSTFRVLGTPGASWPAASGKGVEIAHDSNINKGFLQSYDRGLGQFGALDINASTVTIGGTPGNLAVSGTVAATGAISGPSIRIKPGLGNHGVPFTNGMIMKAVGETTSPSAPPPAGTAVARTDMLILERDGSMGGWRIKNLVVTPSVSIKYSITCSGVDTAGNFKGKVLNDLGAGITAVYADTDNLLQITCIFGNVYNAGEITQVTLHRHNGDWYWQGFMNSTYDQ